MKADCRLYILSEIWHIKFTNWTSFDIFVNKRRQVSHLCFAQRPTSFVDLILDSIASVISKLQCKHISHCLNKNNTEANKVNKK